MGISIDFNRFDLTVIGIHLIVYALVTILTGINTPLSFFVFLLGVLIWISFVDFKSYIIPDFANALLLLGGIAFAVNFQNNIPYQQVVVASMTAGLVYGIGFLFERLRGFPGLGLGDVKFLFAICFWLPVQLIPILVCLSSLAGIFVLLTQNQIKKDSKLLETRIAFGPYLCFFSWYLWNVSF